MVSEKQHCMMALPGSGSGQSLVDQARCRSGGKCACRRLAVCVSMARTLHAVSLHNLSSNMMHGWDRRRLFTGLLPPTGHLGAP